MSDYELWSLVVSGAGFAAVSVSVFLLARQTREMAAQTRSVAESLRDNAFESMKSLVIKIDETFLIYPELRPYFYGGKDISPEEGDLYQKVETLAETVLDILLSITQRRKHFPHIWSVWPQIEFDRYIREVFAKSPILCRYLEQRREWYVPELIKLMNEGQSFGVRPPPCA